MPVYCFEECVAKAAACLSGGASPCGVTVDMLKNWLLRHGVQLERLREVMATWVDWLSSGLPPKLRIVLSTRCTLLPLPKPQGYAHWGLGSVG